MREPQREVPARAPKLAVLVLLLAASGATVAAIEGCSSSTLGSVFAPPITQAPPQKTLDQPIQKVFIVVMENHTTDNYFAGFPGVLDYPVTQGLGRTDDVIPLAVPGSNDWSPGSNDWDTAHADWNGGQMNGFDNGSHQPASSGLALPFLLSLTNPNPVRASGVNGAYVAYGLNPTSAAESIPFWWEQAQAGVLSDNYFSAEMGPSLPNHMYLFAANAGGAISNPEITSGNFTALDLATNERFLEQSVPASAVPTALPNELETAGLSWTILQELDVVTFTDIFFGTAIDVQADNTKLQCMTGLADFNVRYIATPNLDQRLPQYLAAGWGSNVTWIKPNLADSEHPIVSAVTTGEGWAQRVLAAIGDSSDWAHCAIFVTWDDYGGFYDHRPPPQLDAFGLGMRVPCVVIGPYARKGVVDHTLREHSSILKFCEAVFGLPAMSTRDAQADDFMADFDFTQTPRPFSDFQPGATAPVSSSTGGGG
jgi:phospholipase C